MEQGERRRRQRNTILVGVSLIVVCTIAVVVPTAVVLTRRHHNDESKTIINIGEKTRPTTSADEFAGEELVVPLLEHQGSNVFRIEVRDKSEDASNDADFGDDDDDDDDDGSGGYHDEEEEGVLLSDLYMHSSSQANLSPTDSDSNSNSDSEDLVDSEDGISGSTNTSSNASYPVTASPTSSPLTSSPSYPVTASPTSSPLTASPSTLSPTISSPDPPTTGPEEDVPAPQSEIARAVDTYQVLQTIDHEVDAFTQGLTFDPQNSNIVYESTGLYGESDVRIVDIKTGEVLKLVKTPSEIFGEGLAYFSEGGKGRLVHITWKSQRGFVFDAETLMTIEEFEFTTERNEGWGITYNPLKDQFIVTDGSNYLHFWERDGVSFKETGRVPVFIQFSEAFDPQPALNLNEIEWDNATQTVLSNIWQTNLIIRIDPTTGRVVTRYDMSQLYTNRIPEANVLNGIALSGEGDLWVTGKKWPKMYKIVFAE